MTNEEKIKSMSREELAKYLLVELKYPYCAERNCPEDHDCTACIMDWLGEEAKE